MNKKKYEEIVHQSKKKKKDPPKSHKRSCDITESQCTKHGRFNLRNAPLLYRNLANI